jgi:hypothetical protein
MTEKGKIGVVPDYRGRLGNHLFRIAAAHGVAHMRGWQVEISPCQATTMFGIPTSGEDLRLWPSYHEKHFQFDPAVFEIEPGTTLYGYLQTERYFAHCADRIRTLFPVSDGDPIEAVAVHVRRGDYVWNHHRHPPASKRFFREAMSKFPGVRFLVFSDDTSWCKQQEMFAGPRLEIIEGQTDVQDFMHMARCSHHVISNSSYSWWAAWLGTNPEQQVYYPVPWFGPGLPVDWSDLPPQRWHRIAC